MRRFKEMHRTLYRTLCLMLSIAIAFILWLIISRLPATGTVFVSPSLVGEAFIENIRNGILLVHIRDSLIRVILGFALGFVVSIPVAFLLGWYEGFRVIVEPWIQFLRTIPPIALIPIVIVMFGIGTSAKVSKNMVS